jgi:hypothetical protein
MHPVVVLATAGVEMDVLGLSYAEYRPVHRCYFLGGTRVQLFKALATFFDRAVRRRFVQQC